MIDLYKIYGKQISTLLLSVYLSFFVISIFHYHNVNLTIEDHAVFSENLDAGSTDPYTDGQSHCLLNLLANTVYTCFYSNTSLISDLQKISFTQVENIQIYNSNFISIPLLRAPPAAKAQLS